MKKTKRNKQSKHELQRELKAVEEVLAYTVKELYKRNRAIELLIQDGVEPSDEVKQLLQWGRWPV